MRVVPDAPCRAGSDGTPLVLSRARVWRGLNVLARDGYGEWHTVELKAMLAVARCTHCGGRFRVLPCDVPAYKHYSLAVIEHLLERYAGRGWAHSLRTVAWGLLGERSPAHTTLHGWSEGLGAHALGLPAGTLTDRFAGWPLARVLTEAQARRPELRAVWEAEVVVDPRRYRSAARCERLTALVRVLAVAEALRDTPTPAAPVAPAALATWSAATVRWTGSFGLRFPGTFLRTPIERIDRPAQRGWQARAPPRPCR